MRWQWACWNKLISTPHFIVCVWMCVDGAGVCMIKYGHLRLAMSKTSSWVVFGLLCTPFVIPSPSIGLWIGIFYILYFLADKGILLRKAWEAAHSEIQKAIIEVMSMGPHPDIKTLNVGAQRDLNQAEALVLIAALGRTVGVQLASRLYSGDLHILNTRLKSVLSHSKKIGQNQKTLGTTTIKLYLSISISNKTLPTFSTLNAGRKSGESLILRAIPSFSISQISDTGICLFSLSSFVEFGEGSSIQVASGGGGTLSHSSGCSSSSLATTCEGGCSSLAADDPASCAWGALGAAGVGGNSAPYS